MGKCPDAIKRLIDRFSQQSDDIRSPDYNETLIRIDFINPMMQELGWDIDNRQGFAEQYREVVHEDRVKVAGQTKAPDYSFRVGGTRKFFLEAKKPAVDIRNNWEPAYQLRRYAWSAKLSCSLLTDFEEFAIYDTRIQPKQLEKASVARREFIKYTDYPDRWDFLVGTFSKDAVLKGEFDRYCASKKGRGAQLFDDAFLGEIEEWRKSIAGSLARHNAALDDPALNFAVQRIIDRIIFLRIAEDRGTEAVGQLQSLLNGDSVYPRLVSLFRRADERYNSGLFHFAKEKERDEAPDTLTPTLDVDDRTLKGIIKALYYPESPYEFTMVSADILGSVYERFLGKVITLTAGHTARIEEKPEVRKAGGVYYTPTYIVDYIVKNTVGKLLEEKTPKEAARLKVLDPACGSGSFLIGAYQFLLDWYHTQYAASDPQSLATGKKPVLRPGVDGGWALTIAERKRILLDHIHGVDLDGQAVEVTKLNLLLKCLEGETSQTLGFEQRLFRERALPDLGRNILCGNSLIGTDIIGTDAWNAMSEEERGKVNPFDYERAFPTVFKQVGFDAVIGNPPYVRSITLKSADPVSWALYPRLFKSAASREWDIYLVFAERSLSLLSKAGRLGFILPNKFLNSQVGAGLREIIVMGQHLNALLSFGAYQVFDTATTYTCLLFLTAQRNDKVAVSIFAGEIEGKDRPIQPLADPTNWRVVEDIHPKGGAEWSLGSAGASMFKRWAGWKKLGDVAQIFQGTGTRADEVFIIRHIEGQRYESPQLKRTVELESAFVRPVVRGRDVKRYQAVTTFNRLICPYSLKGGRYQLIEEDELAKNPRLLKYLEQCRPRLLEREKGRFNGSDWYCFGRPQNMERLDTREKLLMPDVVARGECWLDRNGCWAIDTVYAIIPSNSSIHLELLMGVLNSRILTFFLKQVGTPLRGGYFRMKTAYLAPLPIPDELLEANASTKRLASLVDNMLSLHKRLAAEKLPQRREQLQREIDATDRKIDELVYQLYGLTDDEIKIVEEATTG
jgi:type I restriction-modification system DNA methylase subunit